MNRKISEYVIPVLIAVSVTFIKPAATSATDLRGTIHEGTSGVEGAHVTVTAGTYTGSGILHRSYFLFHIPDDVITAVATDTPHQTCLLPNYPNPFNPTTTIEFSIDTPGHVALIIYSITGQRVRSLADGGFGAGPHRLVWNGRDDAGQGVAAGVYLYRLITGGAAETRRMLLLDGGGNQAPGAPLTAGDSYAVKPAGDPVLIIDSITVEKAGYRTVTLEDVRLPVNNNSAAIDIEIEPEKRKSWLFHHAGGGGFAGIWQRIWV